jgi:hypothetical protein
MTREQAGDEADDLFVTVRDWRDKRPWSTAIKKRFYALEAYATGGSNTVPDDGWTLESISHLEGAPDQNDTSIPEWLENWGRTKFRV